MNADTEIETIVHMVGDAISRDDFSVERVTTDLHDRLTAVVAGLWPERPTEEMLAAAHSAMQRTTAGTPRGQYCDIYRAMRSVVTAVPDEVTVEREACAKVAEKIRAGWFNGEATTVYGQAYQQACTNIANAIRSRAGGTNAK